MIGLEIILSILLLYVCGYAVDKSTSTPLMLGGYIPYLGFVKYIQKNGEETDVICFAWWWNATLWGRGV